MVRRQFWEKILEDAWTEQSVIWLMGVRRVGKTVLSESMPEVEYFDCERPRVREQIEKDPEGFLEKMSGKRIVLDEIHRISNPSEILKIAADHYPSARVLATGSSSLGASARFRDTLTGRKVAIWLTPMALHDLDDFGRTDLEHRFLRGGLPPFFIARSLSEKRFQEWMDDYWAKDVLELFRIEKRVPFLRFVELLVSQSGGMFEATRFAVPCEVSRATISNYLAILEETFVAHVVRPYSTRRFQEIVSAPKVYAFDTGFVCHYRSWSALRPDDMGLLWEHFVLNDLHAHLQSRKVFYWRSKHGNEVDFVHAPRGKAPAAIECKWSVADFDPASIRAFRKRYPDGENFVVAANIDRSFSRRYGDISVEFVSLPELIQHVHPKAHNEHGARPKPIR